MDAGGGAENGLANGEVMMRMCKEFDFMNGTQTGDKRCECSFPFIGTRKQYSYSDEKKNGCCAYFIDRFYRASFPIQINGFAVVVAAVIAVTLAAATAVFTAFTTYSDGILLAFFVGIQMNRFHFTSDELVAVHKNATNQ